MPVKPKDLLMDLDIRCERQREVKMDSRGFGLSS